MPAFRVMHKGHRQPSIPLQKARMRSRCVFPTGQDTFSGGLSRFRGLKAGSARWKGQGALGLGVRTVLVFSGLYLATCEDAVDDHPSGHKTAIWSLDLAGGYICCENSCWQDGKGLRMCYAFRKIILSHKPGSCCRT